MAGRVAKPSNGLHATAETAVAQPTEQKRPGRSRRQADPSPARTRFDQAVQWMEKYQEQLRQNKQWNEELVRFRAEAEQLMGINQKPETTNPKPEPRKQDSKGGKQVIGHESSRGVAGDARNAVEIVVLAGDIRQAVALH
jgi:hypothetical protein